MRLTSIGTSDSTVSLSCDGSALIAIPAMPDDSSLSPPAPLVTRMLTAFLSPSYAGSCRNPTTSLLPPSSSSSCANTAVEAVATSAAIIKTAASVLIKTNLLSQERECRSEE